MRMNNFGLFLLEDYVLRRFLIFLFLYVFILNEVEDLVKLEDGRYDVEKIVE